MHLSAKPNFCRQTFVNGNVASPRSIAENTTASSSFSRKTNATCLLNRICFFFPAPVWVHEGLKVQGRCTGQPPGTDCFYTGWSPHVLILSDSTVERSWQQRMWLWRGYTSGPTGHQSRSSGCLKRRSAGLSVGNHADAVTCFIAPPASSFET